jgi:hypothetical protein
MTKNPTPFVLAEDAEWQDCGLRGGPVEYRLLPARVYLHPTRTPAVVVRRRGRVMAGEAPSSGYSGLMLDGQGHYAGSIRKSIRKANK